MHHLAAYVGVVTLVVMILWQKLAPARLKWVPGALVGVVAATILARSVNLPIKYVDIPENLFSTIQMPTTAAFPGSATFIFCWPRRRWPSWPAPKPLLSATAVDQMHGGPRTNYNKEMISQGVGNVLAGLAGGLPMTGVIVRSATNVSAGAKTRLSAIMHGLWLLVLVAAAPTVLRLIPTASLAAVLVYTGFKLINVRNIQRLLQYGGIPVAIYAITLIVIVVQDLLTGIVCGLLLSLISIIYSMTHLSIDIRREHDRIDVKLTGAATFLRMPKLIDGLEKLPSDTYVHVHVKHLTYVDHACLDCIAAWEKQRNSKGAETVVEWHALMHHYQRDNSFTNDSVERPLVGTGH